MKRYWRLIFYAALFIAACIGMAINFAYARRVLYLSSIVAVICTAALMIIEVIDVKGKKK